MIVTAASNNLIHIFSWSLKSPSYILLKTLLLALWWCWLYTHNRWRKQVLKWNSFLLKIVIKRMNNFQDRGFWIRVSDPDPVFCLDTVLKNSWFWKRIRSRKFHGSWSLSGFSWEVGSGSESAKYQTGSATLSSVCYFGAKLLFFCPAILIFFSFCLMNSYWIW